MIRRIASLGLAAAVLLTLVLLTPLAAAAPAAAAGPGVGCTGNACSILLTDLITLNGDAGSGATVTPIPLPPPPCLWVPIGNAVSGSSYIIRVYGALLPGTPYGVTAAVRQARQLLATKPAPAGTWYMLPINPAAGPAGRQACRTLPLFFFARPGQAPPVPPIPPLTLAEYAYNHMLIPPPALTINPAGAAYVNLGTFVWGSWPASRTTGRVTAYKITATLGGQTVTVWARTAGFTVRASGSRTVFNRGCGPTGSRHPVGRPPASAGPGVAPDCGVLWQAPDPAATLTATVRWAVSWGTGNLNGPGPQVLPPVSVTGPVPPLAVPVAEIQAVNG
jgi:hypothetical protein